MNTPLAQDFFQLRKAVEKAPADTRLLAEIESFQGVAKSLGILSNKWSPSSLLALAEMPDEKKQSIAKHLKLWASWVDQCQTAKGTVDDFSLLERALAHYSLQMSDEIRETIDKETVVEVYSEDMFQIFRSFSMLSMTSYSLLDLYSHEWFVLWERSQLTLKQMHDDVSYILQTESPFRRSTVTPHIVKENFNTGLTEPFVPRSSFVKFQHIGFLKRLSADAPRAFICTAKGALISEESSELEQIAFL